MHRKNYTQATYFPTIKNEQNWNIPIPNITIKCKQNGKEVFRDGRKGATTKRDNSKDTEDH